MRSPLIVATLLIATSGAAAADPIATAFAAAVVGGGDSLGGAVGARAGLRGPGGWGGHVEAAVLRYAGFGPHAGAHGYHAAIAAQRARQRLHAFVGAAVEQRAARAEDTGREGQVTALGPTAGAGATFGPVQLELSLAVPLITLAHGGDPAAEAAVGAQVMVAVGVGWP